MDGNSLTKRGVLGKDGTVNNTELRCFPKIDPRDSPSRQLARHIKRVADPNVDKISVKLILWINKFPGDNFERTIPNADKPRGIQIQRGKPQISKNKLQITSLSPNVPRLKNSGTSLVGDKNSNPNVQ